MMQIRWLKEYKGSIIGDITNAGAKSAENFVSQGYAEYVVDKNKNTQPADFAKPKKQEEKPQIFTSNYIDNERNTFAEQVYKDGISLFCLYDKDKDDVEFKEKIEIDGVDYLPINDEEVMKKAILLPSGIEEYGSDEELDCDIDCFINKWLDIPKEVVQFALWNIKRSWVYEKFHTLNYLRALGDTGVGKSRFLDTLGYLHYKPIATSGATTSAPIFRIIDKWKGTLIIDEADFKDSDESQDIIKIINQGYEKGKFIMRCDKENNNKVNFFDPYCPKILATRRVFKDKATESRCITQVMKVTNRMDIPLNLNDKFWDESLILRNKLLLWRFRNYHKINPDVDVDFDLGDLEPRVRQIVTSFISLFSNNIDQMEQFKVFIINHQDNLIEERRNSFLGAVVGAIHSLIEKDEIEISNHDIIEEGKLTDMKGDPMHPRSLTRILRGLGFEKTEIKKVGLHTKRCIPIDLDFLWNLFKRYGYVVTKITVIKDTREEKKEDEIAPDSEKPILGGGIRKDCNLGNSVYNRNLKSPQEKKVLEYIDGSKNDDKIEAIEEEVKDE